MSEGVSDTSSDTAEIRRMDIREFREFGFLQEVNRQFFHPLGLAMEVASDDDGNWIVSGVLDYRDDPEGLHFGEAFGDPEDKAKAARVQSLLESKAANRQRLLGYVIQPVETETD